MDEPHHLADGERRRGGVVRRGAVEREGVRRTSDANHCETFHADDEEYFDQVWYWTTPTKECLDGRGPICKDYSEWVRGWTEVKGWPSRPRAAAPAGEAGSAAASGRRAPPVGGRASALFPLPAGRPAARREREGRGVTGDGVVTTRETPSRRGPGRRLPRSSTATGPGWARSSPRRSGGWWSPTSARWSSCSWRRSGASTRSRRRSSTSTRSTTSACSGRATSTPDRAADDRDRRRGDRHRRAARAPDRLLPREGRLAADAGAARRRDPHAAVDELPGQVYAWRIMLAENGFVNWLLEPFGLSGPSYGNVAVWLVMSYLWLPFMILPVYAGFERIPTRCSRRRPTSAATRGRRSGACAPARLPGDCRRLDLHVLAHPRRLHHAAAALVDEFIANVVYVNVGIANNLPLAAAFATVPIVVMIAYLLVARKLQGLRRAVTISPLARLVLRAATALTLCSSGRRSRSSRSTPSTTPGSRRGRSTGSRSSGSGAPSTIPARGTRSSTRCRSRSVRRSSRSRNGNAAHSPWRTTSSGGRPSRSSSSSRSPSPESSRAWR